MISKERVYKINELKDNVYRYVHSRFKEIDALRTSQFSDYFVKVLFIRNGVGISSSFDLAYSENKYLVRCQYDRHIIATSNNVYTELKSVSGHKSDGWKLFSFFFSLHPSTF